MIVVVGKKTAETTRAALDALVARMTVVLDVGAGDGLFAYRYAQAHPGQFVIALDPVRENMRDASAKAARRPDRGGLANVVFVVGSVEQPPRDLERIADEVHVTLPWGSLMRGLILGEPAVLDGIASFGRDAATVRVVLNTRIFDDPVPIDARDLPAPTPEYARETLTPLYEHAGLRIDVARPFDADELLALGTTWAKRLSHRRPPPSLYIEARVDRPPRTGGAP